MLGPFKCLDNEATPICYFQYCSKELLFVVETSSSGYQKQILLLQKKQAAFLSLLNGTQILRYLLNGMIMLGYVIVGIERSCYRYAKKMLKRAYVYHQPEWILTFSHKKLV